MQHLAALTHNRFSLIHFRSPLLTESLLFSLPVGTEMFHFPTFPLNTLYIQMRVTTHNAAGFPHSDTLGSTPVYRLPEAYRRLLRPSSAPDAKASTICSSQFDMNTRNRNNHQPRRAWQSNHSHNYRKITHHNTNGIAAKMLASTM